MKTNKKWTEERKDYLTVALMVTVLWQQWLFQTVERKRPAREVTVLLFPSVMRCFFSLILLFPLSTMFFPLCSGFVEVLAAAAWGVAWTVVDLSSSSSLCFSSALFSSVSVLFFSLLSARFFPSVFSLFFSFLPLSSVRFLLPLLGLFSLLSSLSSWSVLLQFLSSLSPLFAPVLSSPSVADGVFCCQQCSSFSATSSWRCWWQGMTAAAPPPGVVAAAGMEEKMRSVWGSVDREGCFGCSLSFSFQKHASPFSFPAPSRSTKLSSF